MISFIAKALCKHAAGYCHCNAGEKIKADQNTERGETEIKPTNQTSRGRCELTEIESPYPSQLLLKQARMTERSCIGMSRRSLGDCSLYDTENLREGAPRLSAA